MESDTTQTRQAPGRAQERPQVVAAPPPAPAPQDLTPEEQAAKKTQIMIIGGAILFLVILVVAIILMALNPGATQVIRDIAIVFVAVETFLIGLAMILLLFQIQVLIQVLRDEIQPLLRSVNDTASTVRGTTAFVSHNVVSPLIRVASVTSAAQKVARGIFDVAKGVRPRPRGVTQPPNHPEEV